jgi:hypothetical protein
LRGRPILLLSYCVFVLPAQEVLQYILERYRYATDLNSRRRFFLRRDIAGEAVIRMAIGFASVSPRRQIPTTDPRRNFTELLHVEAPGKNLQHLARKNTRQFELIETKNSSYIVRLQVESGWKNSKSSPSLFGPELKNKGGLDVYLLNR